MDIKTIVFLIIQVIFLVWGIAEIKSKRGRITLGWFNVIIPLFFYVLALIAWGLIF